MCASLTSSAVPLRLFEAFGIELEYMIVDKETLNIAPIANKLLEAIAGEICSEYDKEGISWTNELVMHLIEFKTTLPEKSLKPLPQLFFTDVQRANALLDKFHAQLMPTAMHPWMDPFKEMHLWPYEQNEIYTTYNKIFDCRGHGWANLQSCHINLPFGDDKEFHRLHSAIRLVLPLIPGIAASSPIADGNDSGHADNRLFVYQKNSIKIPSISGRIIPEVCKSYSDYQENILQKIYRDIAPYDPEKILQFEWCNSRGAIARFDRQSIEIRLVDIQECPRSDIAVASAIIAAVKAFSEERFGCAIQYDAFSEGRLKAILDQTITNGEKAFIDDVPFLELFGYQAKGCYVSELWEHLLEKTADLIDKAHMEILQMILDKGTLASRIRKALPKDFARDDLRSVYGELCRSLANNQLFCP
jgi:hypothetical protein